MREIDCEEITNTVARLCIEACYGLPQDVLAALEMALTHEEDRLGRWFLQKTLENACFAREDQTPVCQDTGIAVFFINLGQDIHICNGSLVEAINEGVCRGYTEGYLRKSMVEDPLFKRINTGNNTPAVIHIEITPGDQMEIIFMPKGGGGESVSKVAWLYPGTGVEGLKRFVVKAVEDASLANPCLPIIVGVGVGGSIEYTMYLAKKALTRPLNLPNPDARLTELEADLLSEINSLGIGPQALGGRTTALGVRIETFGTFMASLPVAVNIQCGSPRLARSLL